MRKKPWPCRWWKFTKTNRLSLFWCNFYFLTQIITRANQVHSLVWGCIFNGRVFCNYVSTIVLNSTHAIMHGCLRGPRKEFFACYIHMLLRASLVYILLCIILIFKTEWAACKNFSSFNLWLMSHWVRGWEEATLRDSTPNHASCITFPPDIYNKEYFYGESEWKYLHCSV